MLIIGELLNSSNTRIKDIFEKRNEEGLLEVAEAQIAAGAFALDLNTSMLMEGEREALLWAARIIRSRLGAVVSLDTPSSNLLIDLAGEFGEGAILNSFTVDEKEIERAIDAAGRTGCSVIIMLKSGEGIPDTAMLRLGLASEVSIITKRASVDTSQIFLDPVLTPLATTRDGLRVALDTIEGLKRNFPNFRSVGGISNVSFGLPRRRLVNRTFLAMALARGLDAAICDPTDQEIIGTLRTAEVAMGSDPGCKNFLAHHRSKNC